MTRNNGKYLQNWLLTGLIVGSSLTLLNCSGEKKAETTTETTETTADSSFIGRQGDTLNSSSIDAPQQAPPDSASAQGAIVPAEVKVRVKQ